MSVSSPAALQPFLSFLVCTYHREDLIGPCIASIAAQYGIERGDCEIVVVDNSDEGTAAGIVSQIAGLYPVPVVYVQAHPANISVARNAGVRATSATYIAMIDDDMTVIPEWLEHARKALENHSFDVYSGPVVPLYERPELATAQTKAFFHRQMAVEGLTVLNIMGKRRTPGYIPATSNSIFKRDTCFPDSVLFDEQYGKSGGEDLDLFCRLENRGCTFAWLPDILTYERVPARRCEIDYLEKRSFVGGQVYASAHILNSPRPWMMRARITCIALVQLALLLPRKLLPASANNPRAADLRLRFAAVLGKLAWRNLVPFYQLEKNRG